jgi:hypothetical protein
VVAVPAFSTPPPAVVHKVAGAHAGGTQSFATVTTLTGAIGTPRPVNVVVKRCPTVGVVTSSQADQSKGS